MELNVSFCKLMIVIIEQNCRILWQSSECDQVCVGAWGFTWGVYHSPDLCTEVCPVQAGAYQPGQRAVRPQKVVVLLEVILWGCCIIIKGACILKKQRKKMNCINWCLTVCRCYNLPGYSFRRITISAMY